MSAVHKRQRTPSQSSSYSSSTDHSSKVTRLTPEVESISNNPSHPLLCTLPPTCNHRPTPIANTKDLEAHYAKFHAHVCEENRCGCVFPDARLLELHQMECHDPLAAVRKERGEKIFACHLATCPRLFMTPKARRLHLIQAHGYPKEYFFAVTNKGVGGLLKRWGEGVSMIRKEWKPREEKGKGKEVDVNRMDIRGDDENSDESSDDEEETEDMEIKPSVVEEDEAEEQPTPRVQPRLNPGNTDDANVDALAGSMSSLALVPSSIRFGRGGVKGGFGHTPEPNAHSRGTGRGRGMPGQATAAGHTMSVDTSSNDAQSPPAQGEAANANANGHTSGRGRGYTHLNQNRGGRGGIIYPPRGFLGRGRIMHRGGVVPGRGAFPRGRGRGAAP